MAESASSAGNLDPTSRGILTAAVTSIGKDGIAHTTMERVAKLAGIGVATVYRRFSKKDNLIQAAVRFEAQRFLENMSKHINPEDPFEDQLLDGFVGFIREARNRPLLKGIDGAGGVGLPLIALNGSLLVETGAAFAAKMIEEQQKSGRLPQFDPFPIAEIFARLGHSIVLAPKGCIPIDDEAEARKFAISYLVPILGIGVASGFTGEASFSGAADFSGASEFPGAM